MSRSSLLAAMLVAACAGLASYPVRAATISVGPPNPTAADSVRVTVRGGFSSLCWNYVGPASCTAGPADTLAIVVPVNYCNGLSNCSCGQFPVGYSRTCEFGPQPAGSYVIVFTELHVNPADPLPTEITTGRCSVSGPTPVSHRSWGVLKAIYR